MWAKGCEASQRTEVECSELINNPVEIEDFEALYDKNDAICRNYGVEDGKADKPSPDEFTMNVAGNNPSPSSFPGSSEGTMLVHGRLTL